MAPSIKAIPQVHDGVKFRSRTEARWAEFFRTQWIPVAYEPEGYQTDLGWYLPDFQLIAAPTPVFFEVKPKRPTMREYGLLEVLARGAQAHVFVTHGNPSGITTVEKVYSTGERQEWFFARDTNGECSYLVDRLIECRHALPIRKSPAAVTAPVRGLERELDAAGAMQFQERPKRPVRASAALRRSRLVAEPCTAPTPLSVAEDNWKPLGDLAKALAERRRTK